MINYSEFKLKIAPPAVTTLLLLKTEDYMFILQSKVIE